MFKTLLALCVFAASAIATAAPKNKAYELKMEFVQNGKIVSSPHVTVNNGEKASVTSENKNEVTSFEVMATEATVDNKKGIRLEFTVSFQGEKGRTVSAKPQILVKENELARVSVADETGKEAFILNVTAKTVTKN